MTAVTGEMSDRIRKTLLKESQAYLSRGGIDSKVIKCEVKDLDQGELAYHAGSIMYKGQLTLEESGIVTSHSILIKTMPATALMQQTMNSGMQFDDEHVMYHSIIPLLLKKTAFYTYKELYDFWKPADLFPRCFYSNTGDSENAMIVLEDLRLKGYRVRGHSVTLAMEFSDVLIATRALARFHALSYDLKLREPELFREYVANKVKDTRMFMAEPGDNEVNTYNIYLHHGSLLPCPWLEKEDTEGKYKSEMQKLRDKLKYTNLLKDCVAPKEPLAVLCHGDYVMNNFLFKDEDVKLIDFQTALYSSPIIDLATLFFMHGADFVSRWDELLEEYHRSLIRCLGRQPEEFSLNAFREDFTRCGIFGYIISAPFLIFLGEHPEEQTFDDLIRDSPEETKSLLQSVKLENKSTAQRTVALLREVLDRGLV